MHKYEIVIWWSEEDQLYLAKAPELPGCVVHGQTPEEALKEINFLIPHWLEMLEETGRPVPQPRGEPVSA